MVDGFADLLGTEDAQTIRVTLERNDVSTLYRDERTRQQLLESLRQRADLLRTRAREQFIEAAPRDPLPPTPDRSPGK